ncbi:unnamed protein product [Parajaminaea phylloscopi]
MRFTSSAILALSALTLSVAAQSDPLSGLTGALHPEDADISVGGHRLPLDQLPRRGLAGDGDALSGLTKVLDPSKFDVEVADHKLPLGQRAAGASSGLDPSDFFEQTAENMPKLVKIGARSRKMERRLAAGKVEGLDGFKIAGEEVPVVSDLPLSQLGAQKRQASSGLNGLPLQSLTGLVPIRKRLAEPLADLVNAAELGP